MGGHGGRADDYHYHLAPLHLQKTMGTSLPVAYALDGYPIFTYQDEKSPDFAPLDRLSGHKDKDGNYHYHGLPGCVTAQVDTQEGPSHIIGFALDGFPIYGARDINRYGDGDFVAHSDRDSHAFANGH